MTLLFILGTGRCGSTMVQEVVARHHDVGFISNLDDRTTMVDSLGRWNNSLYRITPSRYTQRDRSRVIKGGDPRERHFGPSEAYDLLERQISPMLGTTFRDLTADDAFPWVAGRMRDFFQRRIEAQKKPVFLHKFTGWPRARFLHAIFPNARFLHVVRDGRAVANSLAQRQWWKGYRGLAEWGRGPLPNEYEREWVESGHDFVVLAALEWKMLMDVFDESRASLPPDRWMQLRYEDFVHDPRARLTEIFDFTGLSWTPPFDKTFASFAFTKEKTDRYKRDLTNRQLETLDRILARKLESLGYETADSD